MNNFKWIVVMGVEEYRDSLNEVFQRSGIEAFSEVQVKGFRFTQSQLDSEEVPSGPMNPVYSVVCFSLIMEDQAKVLMEQINQFNKGHERARALHAFQVNVEAVV